MTSGVAVLLAAVLGVVTTGEPAQDPSSVEQIRHARTEADRIIASAAHPSGLVNVTDSRFPAVLHRVSNLECSFFDEGTPAIANDEADTFVMCGSSFPESETVSMALRLNRQATEEELIQSADRMVRTTHPDAVHEGNVSPRRTPQAGDPVGSRFKATKDGTDLAVVVLAIQRNGWVYFSVVSGPYDLKDRWEAIALISIVGITEGFSKSR